MDEKNFFPTFQSAVDYDSFIDWKKRLEREIPFLTEYLRGESILDVACGSGRHSFALMKKGFTVIGIDYSQNIIHLAKKMSRDAKNLDFYVIDATNSYLKEFLADKGYSNFDNSIILGNSIANMGSYQKASQVIHNIHSVLKSRGRFIVQTINKPSTPYFLPLRKLDRGIIQRVMFPLQKKATDYNVELHFKLIEPNSLSYLESKVDHLYMFYSKEFEELVLDSGFKLLDKFGGFNKEPFSDEETKTVVWIFEKD